MAATKKATGGPKKKVSAYNSYMKGALAKVKKENPNITHKEAFTKAAKQWKTSPENPKREK